MEEKQKGNRITKREKQVEDGYGPNFAFSSVPPASTSHIARQCTWRWTKCLTSARRYDNDDLFFFLNTIIIIFGRLTYFMKFPIVMKLACSPLQLFSPFLSYSAWLDSIRLIIIIFGIKTAVILIITVKDMNKIATTIIIRVIVIITIIIIIIIIIIIMVLITATIIVIIIIIIIIIKIKIKIKINRKQRKQTRLSWSPKPIDSATVSFSRVPLSSKSYVETRRSTYTGIVVIVADCSAFDRRMRSNACRHHPSYQGRCWRSITIQSY
jgi:hypothetical protein